MKKYFLRIACLSMVALVVASCDKKEEPAPSGDAGKVLVQTVVINQDGMNGSSYLQVIPDFTSQSLDNKNSIQVGFDAPVRVIGKDVYVFPGFGPTDASVLTKYTWDGTRTLQKTATLQLPSGSLAGGLVNYNSEKAYLPLFGIGKVWIINPITLTKTGEIDFSEYAHGEGDTNADPGYAFLRGDYLYVPLCQLTSMQKPYSDYKQADCAVIDPKTDKVLHIASEKTSKITFPTRPFGKDMIFTDESNNLYMACVSAFGMDDHFTETGFVCIPDGKTEFDASLSWDISKTTIEGTAYKGGPVAYSKYIGNGKVIAYLMIPELQNAAYISRYSMPVVIDLKAKTIKQIKGLSISDPHSVFIETYKDLVVIASNGEKDPGFYTYDPKTGKVSNGAVIATTGNPYHIHFFE